MQTAQETQPRPGRFRRASAARNAVLLALALAGSPALAKDPGDVVDAAANGSFGTLVEALRAAGLVDALRGEGPFTVFAPTDDAFAKLPEGTLDALLEPENRNELEAVLLHHVVPGRLDLSDLLAAGSVKTLQGSTLAVRLADAHLRVGGARVLTADVACRNGIVHAIDAVLLPPHPAATARDRALDLLTLAIERGVPLFNAGQPKACADVYEVAARAVVDLGALEGAERATIERALQGLPQAGDDAARAWLLRRAFDAVLGAAAPAASHDEADAPFEPIREAPLPEGFPGPGPVGEIVVKTYPRYRAARVEGGAAAFWTLFGHIKRNEIAMTAPVEMGMAPDAEDLVVRDMAFLYERAGQGEAGRDGRVEVVDLEEVRVLSIGLLGPLTQDRLRDARAALERRMERDGLARAGGWRLLGYNSPMVPATQRFYELQAPIAGRP